MSHARPICGAPLHRVPRFPHYVSEGCASKAAAAEDWRPQFSNVDASGGFEARYGDAGEVHASHACWINGIPGQAGEAHFSAVEMEVTQ